MWELITENKQKSLWIFFMMLLILVLNGFSVGVLIYYPDGAYIGIIVSLFLWIFLSTISWFFGDKIILNVSKATQVTPEFYPQLYNIAEEMKIAANLQYMPEIYVIDDDALNAFATGMRPEKSAIAVTSGLLENLTRDELQGVIAHEMSHIINRDVMFMTFAGIMLGAVTMISNFFFRGGGSVGGESRRSKLRGGNGIPPVLLIAALIIAALAPLLIRVFYFSLSRKREFLADACAVRLTRYPEGLAGALEKISMSLTPLFYANKITAPMYITNPFKMEFDADTMFATHPPVHVRIKVLRTLNGNVSYSNYHQAYRKITGKLEGIMPKTGVSDREAVAARSASLDAPIKERSKKSLHDVMLASNGFVFMPCDCGLNIKVPPSIGAKELACPRCGKILTIPSITAGINYTNETYKSQEKEVETFNYKRKSDSWESFICKCGHIIQISPLFKSEFLKCRVCGRKINID